MNADLKHSNRSALSHIPCRVTYGMVSIPESSALTLRLLDDDDSNAGVAREDVLLLSRVAVILPLGWGHF